MSRLTLVVRGVVLALAAVGLVAAGLWVGAIVQGNAVDRLAPEGALMEVHLVNGTVYLGTVEANQASVSLSGPAVVVPQSATQETTSYAIEPISGDPYNIAGPILIERSQVAFIGAVRAGSGIEVAYREAMVGTSVTTPEPPSPSD